MSHITATICVFALSWQQFSCGTYRGNDKSLRSVQFCNGYNLQVSPIMATISLVNSTFLKKNPDHYTEEEFPCVTVQGNVQSLFSVQFCNYTNSTFVKALNCNTNFFKSLCRVSALYCIQVRSAMNKMLTVSSKIPHNFCGILLLKIT